MKFQLTTIASLRSSRARSIKKQEPDRERKWGSGDGYF